MISLLGCWFYIHKMFPLQLVKQISGDNIGKLGSSFSREFLKRQPTKFQHSCSKHTKKSQPFYLSTLRATGCVTTNTYRFSVRLQLEFINPSCRMELIGVTSVKLIEQILYVHISISDRMLRFLTTVSPSEALGFSLLEAS